MRSGTDHLRDQRGAAGRAGLLFARTAALALVVALPIVVTPWGMDAYSSIKAALTRVLALTVLLGWGVAYAVVREPKWRRTLPEIALWVYVLALLASSAATVNPLLTFFGGPLRHEGLLVAGSYIVFYFAGVHFFGSRHGLRSLVTPAAAAAIVAIGYGLVQPFVQPLFAGEAFTRQQYSGLGLLRVSSTVGGPVTFAGYLAFILPILGTLAVCSSNRRRILWLLGVAGAVTVLVLTLTRAAWLAALVGFAVFMGGAGEARRDRHLSVVLLVSVALGVTLFLTVVAAPPALTSRVTSAVDTRSGSLAQRLYIWDQTLVLVRARPVLGWGLETLREVFPYDRPALVRLFGLTPVIIDRAHNDVLQVAVSIGVPGAVAYVIFWILVLTGAARFLNRTRGADRLVIAGATGAILAYLVQVQFSFSSVSVTPIVWLLAGALSGWSAQPPATRSELDPQ